MASDFVGAVRADRLSASNTRLESLLERVAPLLPMEVRECVEKELASGVRASPSRLLQACRDLQDACGGQLMPEIRPLFAGLRDHALLLDSPADAASPIGGDDGEQASLLIDLPVVPLPTLADHPFEREYHVVREEDGAHITSHGTGQIVLGLRLEEAQQGVAIQVSLAGTGRANLHGRRGRVEMQGLLHSNLSAATLVRINDAGLQHSPPRVSVRNRIDLVDVGFQGRLPLVSRVGSRVASRAVDRLVPELTSRSEHEMRRQLASESGRLLDDTSEKIEASTSPLIGRMGDEAGISLTLGGTAVDARARITICAEIDAALPASAAKATPPLNASETEGRLEIHLHESLPTRLADLAGGAMLLETDFRELCLEPLGMVPEFDPEVQFGVEAARVRLAVVRPVTVSFQESSFSIDVRLDSYQTGLGQSAGPTRIVASYGIEMNGGALTLSRQGPPRCEAPLADPAVDLLAKRFFPIRATSTEVSLLEELLRSVSMTRGQFNLRPEWLGIEVEYEPKEVAARLGEFMP